MGRWLVYIGVAFVVAGVVVMVAEKAGIRLGRLPGDIMIRGRNGSFYFPVVTCLIVSVLLSLIGWLLGRR